MGVKGRRGKDTMFMTCPDKLRVEFYVVCSQSSVIAQEWYSNHDRSALVVLLDFRFRPELVVPQKEKKGKALRSVTTDVDF